MKILIVVIAFGFLPGMAFGSEGGNHRLELNAFYGLDFVSPSNLNQSITETNALASSPAGTFSSATSLGGELIYNFSPQFGLGGRYTSTANTTTKGTLLTQDLFYKTDIADATLVAKYFIHRGSITWILGAAGGVTTSFKLTGTVGTTPTEYTPTTNPIVGRGFLGMRWSSGMLGLSLEGGYQMLSAADLKRANGNKLTLNNGSTVVADFSGAYAIAGIGINF